MKRKNTANSLVGYLVILVAAACFCAAILLQPWCELGFGFNAANVPSWAKGIVNSVPYRHLKKYGQLAQAKLQEQGADSNYGEYTYSLVLFGILTIMGVAYVVVGRDPAEEKTILPVKK